MKIKFKTSAVLVVFLFVIFFFAPTAKAVNYTIIGYNYNGGIASQTLTKDKSPYLILGRCSNNKLDVGKTLIIEAGVVVKFAASAPCGMWGTVHSGLYVYGNLIVNGTKEDPVIFTSWYDDVYGGDTNGDGNITHPNPNDWDIVQLNSISGNLSIKNAIFRYGGYRGALMSVSSQAVTPILENLEFAYSSTFGISTNKSFAIHNSSFHDNNQGAIQAASSWYTPQIDATMNWWGDDSGPTTSSNPNGKGQKINGNVLYDPWIGKITKKDPVIIVPGMLGSQEKNGVWVIDPLLHTYDNLFDTFKANGYTEGENLFTFPYDWHQSNVLTAFQLHQKIDEVKTICNCDKVDLVAHSMGGLVSRQYIQSDYYENDVDQLIFLGTPHLGAPKAYLTWEAGEFQSTISDKVVYFLINNESKKLDYNNVFDYINQRPIISLRELLPIYDYLYDFSNEIMRTYPSNYPNNVFLEELNNTQNLSKLYSSGVDITNIVGDVGINNTISRIRVINSDYLPLWQHGFPDGFNSWIGDRGLEMGKGDETVPIISAKYIDKNVKIYNSDHTSLPTNAENFVFNKLTNSESSTNFRNFNLNIGLLIIKILSPADIVVIAPDGKRIGKDFTTNQEVNEIDGSFYSGFLTDNEFITIPNPMDGEYKVMTQGTDNGGDYTIAVGYISENAYVDRDIKGHILPGMITSIDINMDNNTPENLNLTPEDQDSPNITIVSPEAKDYIRQDILSFNASSTDLGSGLFSQKLLFDDKIVNNNDSVDLFITPLGNHVFTVIAEDYQGNTATSTVNFRVIVTPDSMMSDIQKMYMLGWIDSKGAMEDLLNKLKRIIHLENIDTEKIQQQCIERKIDKVLGKKLLKEIEKRQNKSINDQAYDLLIEDVNWLLNN